MSPILGKVGLLASQLHGNNYDNTELNSTTTVIKCAHQMIEFLEHQLLSSRSGRVHCKHMLRFSCFLDFSRENDLPAEFPLNPIYKDM